MTCEVQGCDAEVVLQCKCIRGHKRCSKGHEWHTCLECGSIVFEPADHSKPPPKCTCEDRTEGP